VFIHSKDHIEIIEIGPREGLQDHPTYIDVESKVSLITALFESGFKKIEAVSFVHPKTMPQMRDGPEILGKIERPAGKAIQALVPNETGCRNAIACKADEIVVWTYPTDELNYLTLNRSISMTFKEISAILEIARDSGIPVSAWIGCGFGYPGMNEQFWRDVTDMTKHLIHMGCTEVCLSDEFCMANPRIIYAHLKELLNEVDKSQLLVHFHDNRGLGLANIIASYNVGIYKFKACLGGAGRHTDLSGVAEKKANDNMFPSVPTEDMAYAFEEIGIHTGIDVNKLIASGRLLEGILEKKLYSKVVANNISKEDFIRNSSEKNT